MIWIRSCPLYRQIGRFESYVTLANTFARFHSQIPNYQSWIGWHFSQSWLFLRHLQPSWAYYRPKADLCLKIFGYRFKSCATLLIILLTGSIFSTSNTIPTLEICGPHFLAAGGVALFAVILSTPLSTPISQGYPTGSWTDWYPMTQWRANESFHGGKIPKQLYEMKWADVKDFCFSSAIFWQTLRANYCLSQWSFLVPGPV